MKKLLIHRCYTCPYCDGDYFCSELTRIVGDIELDKIVGYGDIPADCPLPDAEGEA